MPFLGHFEITRENRNAIDREVFAIGAWISEISSATGLDPDSEVDYVEPKITPAPSVQLTATKLESRRGSDSTGCRSSCQYRWSGPWSGSWDDAQESEDLGLSDRDDAEHCSAEGTRLTNLARRFAQTLRRNTSPHSSNGQRRAGSPGLDIPVGPDSEHGAQAAKEAFREAIIKMWLEQHFTKDPWHLGCVCAKQLQTEAAEAAMVKAEGSSAK